MFGWKKRKGRFTSEQTWAVGIKSEIFMIDHSSLISLMSGEWVKWVEWVEEMSGEWVKWLMSEMSDEWRLKFLHSSLNSLISLNSIILHSSSLMSEMSDEWSLISLITHCIILLNPGKDKSIHQREINHLHVKCVQEVSVMKFFLTHLTLENVITLMFGMCCQFLIGFFHLQTLLENYHLLFRILN